MFAVIMSRREVSKKSVTDEAMEKVSTKLGKDKRNERKESEGERELGEQHFMCLGLSKSLMLQRISVNDSIAHSSSSQMLL